MLFGDNKLSLNGDERSLLTLISLILSFSGSCYLTIPLAIK
jgi:hypothetical protein